MAFLAFDLAAFQELFDKTQAWLFLLPPRDRLRDPGVNTAVAEVLWQEADLQRQGQAWSDDLPTVADVFGRRRLEHGHTGDPLGQPDFMVMSPGDLVAVKDWLQSTRTWIPETPPSVFDQPNASANVAQQVPFSWGGIATSITADITRDFKDSSLYRNPHSFSYEGVYDAFKLRLRDALALRPPIQETPPEDIKSWAAWADYAQRLYFSINPHELQPIFAKNSPRSLDSFAGATSLDMAFLLSRIDTHSAPCNTLFLGELLKAPGFLPRFLEATQIQQFISGNPRKSESHGDPDGGLQCAFFAARMLLNGPIRKRLFQALSSKGGIFSSQSSQREPPHISLDVERFITLAAEIQHHRPAFLKTMGLDLNINIKEILPPVNILRWQWTTPDPSGADAMSFNTPEMFTEIHRRLLPLVTRDIMLRESKEIRNSLDPSVAQGETPTVIPTVLIGGRLALLKETTGLPNVDATAYSTYATVDDNGGLLTLLKETMGTPNVAATVHTTTDATMGVDLASLDELRVRDQTRQALRVLLAADPSVADQFCVDTLPGMSGNVGGGFGARVAENLLRFITKSWVSPAANRLLDGGWDCGMGFVPDFSALEDKPFAQEVTKRAFYRQILSLREMFLEDRWIDETGPNSVKNPQGFENYDVNGQKIVVRTIFFSLLAGDFLGRPFDDLKKDVLPQIFLAASLPVDDARPYALLGHLDPSLTPRRLLGLTRLHYMLTLSLVDHQIREALEAAKNDGSEHLPQQGWVASDAVTLTHGRINLHPQPGLTHEDLLGFLRLARRSIKLWGRSEIQWCLRDSEEHFLDVESLALLSKIQDHFSQPWRWDYVGPNLLQEPPALEDGHGFDVDLKSLAAESLRHGSRQNLFLYATIKGLVYKSFLSKEQGPNPDTIETLEPTIVTGSPTWDTWLIDQTRSDDLSLDLDLWAYSEDGLHNIFTQDLYLHQHFPALIREMRGVAASVAVQAWPGAQALSATLRDLSDAWSLMREAFQSRATQKNLRRFIDLIPLGATREDFSAIFDLLEQMAAGRHPEVPVHNESQDLDDLAEFVTRHKRHRAAVCLFTVFDALPLSSHEVSSETDRTALRDTLCRMSDIYRVCPQALDPIEVPFDRYDVGPLEPKGADDLHMTFFTAGMLEGLDAGRRAIRSGEPLSPQVRKLWQKWWDCNSNQQFDYINGALKHAADVLSQAAAREINQRGQDFFNNPTRLHPLFPTMPVSDNTSDDKGSMINLSASEISSWAQQITDFAGRLSMAREGPTFSQMMANLAKSFSPQNVNGEGVSVLLPHAASNAAKRKGYSGDDLQDIPLRERIQMMGVVLGTAAILRDQSKSNVNELRDMSTVWLPLIHSLPRSFDHQSLQDQNELQKGTEILQTLIYHFSDQCRGPSSLGYEMMRWLGSHTFNAILDDEGFHLRWLHRADVDTLKSMPLMPGVLWAGTVDDDFRDACNKERRLFTNIQQNNDAHPIFRGRHRWYIPKNFDDLKGLASIKNPESWTHLKLGSTEQQSQLILQLVVDWDLDSLRPKLCSDDGLYQALVGHVEQEPLHVDGLPVGLLMPHEVLCPLRNSWGFGNHLEIFGTSEGSWEHTQPKPVHFFNGQTFNPIDQIVVDGKTFVSLHRRNDGPHMDDPGLFHLLAIKPDIFYRIPAEALDKARGFLSDEFIGFSMHPKHGSPLIYFDPDALAVSQKLPLLRGLMSSKSAFDAAAMWVKLRRETPADKESRSLSATLAAYAKKSSKGLDIDISSLTRFWDREIKEGWQHDEQPFLKEVRYLVTMNLLALPFSKNSEAGVRADVHHGWGDAEHLFFLDSVFAWHGVEQEPEDAAEKEQRHEAIFSLAKQSILRLSPDALGLLVQKIQSRPTEGADPADLGPNDRQRRINLLAQIRRALMTETTLKVKGNHPRKGRSSAKRVGI